MDDANAGRSLVERRGGAARLLARAGSVGWAVFGACAAGVVLVATMAKGPKPWPQADAPQRTQLAKELAAQEEGWILEARQGFPGDLWSQDDDFARRESEAAMAAARANHIRLEDVVRAIDEELRRDPGERKRGSAPCKPRPFYD